MSHYYHTTYNVQLPPRTRNNFTCFFFTQRTTYNFPYMCTYRKLWSSSAMKLLYQSSVSLGFQWKFELKKETNSLRDYLIYNVWEWFTIFQLFKEGWFLPDLWRLTILSFCFFSVFLNCLVFCVVLRLKPSLETCPFRISSAQRTTYNSSPVPATTPPAACRG